jgi:RNA polymerase sigma-70 factor (ECF subfamily)
MVYRKHQATIFRFARLMTGCNAAAEDVVQEVFLTLMRDPSRYDARQSRLTTYLYGIARRQTRRRLLRERRFVAIGGSAVHDQAAGGDVDDELARRSDMRALRQAILALPSRYREALVLCDLQDVSYADAAETLGCPVGTIRSRLHRARQLLIDRLRRARSERDRDRSGTAAMPSARVRCAI